MQVSDDPVLAAFQRLVDALNRPRDLQALRAAVADDVQIDRHAPGDRGAPIAERFAGLAEVERWFARTPASCRFGLTGAARADGDGWLIEYTLDAGEFHNGGLWLARLACDGRIVALSHHPFALRSAPPSTPHAHTHGG